jgi:zinc D-Ala-D-Ala dipeptidase
MKFDRSIPHGSIRSTVSYRAIALDPASPFVRDPLVGVASYGIGHDAYYAQTDGQNPPYRRPISGSTPTLRLRREVVRRLVRVNASLKPLGLGLLILDAHRSLECQRGLWKYFIGRAARQLPGATRAERERYALQYCSDPRSFDVNDSATWPTHLTGGAVDLTLRRIHGAREEVFMGSIFDEASAISDTDHFERHLRNESDLAARTHRRVLYWSMATEGFTNLASEWWHYDWGTQLWAAVWNATQRRGPRVKAVYGPVTH